MKAHAFGDLNELNLEPYVILHAPPASSLGIYPTLQHKTRSQHESTKAGLSLLCSGSWRPHSDTQMIPNQASPHLGGSTSYHEWSSRKRAALDRDQPWLPREGGCACSLQVSLTQPSIPATEFSSSHATGTPLSMVTSDLVITKPQISLFAPSFSLAFDGIYILKIPLPSPVTLPSGMSSLRDHSITKIFLFFLPQNKRVLQRKSEDWKHDFTQGWRKTSTKYSAKAEGTDLREQKWYGIMEWMGYNKR